MYLHNSQVYRNNLSGLSNKGGSRISSAVLHQHAMGRHGIHSMSASGRGSAANGGNLSPSTASSPLTLSPSSSMTMSSVDVADSGYDGNSKDSSGNGRRSSLYNNNNGNTQSAEEQENEIFRMLQRQTASALRGGKPLHPILSEDSGRERKGKTGGENNDTHVLPTIYDVATLQFN